jgi:negative regulator of sigma E activity
MGACDYEAVSALVDGELSEQECETVIRHLNECRHCCRLFERFHATRSLVRGEGDVVVPVELSERISAAISREEPLKPSTGTAKVVAGPGAKAKTARPSWTWLASAAGVAGLALVAGTLLLSNDEGPGSASSPSLASSDQPNPEAASRSRAPSAEQDNSVATIQRYLPEHSSFVPSGPDAEFQRTRLEVKDR